jgi:CMD domain protein
LIIARAGVVRCYLEGTSMSTVSITSSDVIDRILGVEAGSPIAALRAQKPNLATELQAYYDALFNPAPESAVAFPLVDRALIAVRVASFTKSEETAAWYAALAAEAGADAQTIARARAVDVPWTDETPLGAAVRHADLVTVSPSKARPKHLQALTNAGFSPAGILSLAQVIAFVNYQLRLVTGLRAFGGQA